MWLCGVVRTDQDRYSDRFQLGWDYCNYGTLWLITEFTYFPRSIKVQIWIAKWLIQTDRLREGTMDLRTTNLMPSVSWGGCLVMNWVTFCLDGRIMDSRLSKDSWKVIPPAMASLVLLRRIIPGSILNWSLNREGAGVRPKFYYVDHHWLI